MNSSVEEGWPRLKPIIVVKMQVADICFYEETIKYVRSDLWQ